MNLCSEYEDNFEFEQSGVILKFKTFKGLFLTRDYFPLGLAVDFALVNLLKWLHNMEEVDLKCKVLTPEICGYQIHVQGNRVSGARLWYSSSFIFQ